MTQIDVVLCNRQSWKNQVNEFKRAYVSPYKAHPKPPTPKIRKKLPQAFTFAEPILGKKKSSTPKNKVLDKLY